MASKFDLTEIMQTTRNSSTTEDLNQPISKRKSNRSRKMPSRYEDDAGINSDNEDDYICLPERLAPLITIDKELTKPGSSSNNKGTPFSTPIGLALIAFYTSEISSSSGLMKWWSSMRNKFSLWRRSYASQPLNHDPESNITPEDLDDSHPLPDPIPPNNDPSASTSKPYGPFPNTSSLLFADWYWNRGNEKSLGELDGLINGVFKNPDFVLDDLIEVDWKKLRSALGSQDDENDWFDDAGWTATPISIPVAFHRLMSDAGMKFVTVGKLQHRKILAVIEEKIRNTKDASLFHYQPYELYWAKNEDSPNIRIQGELYTSPAFLEEHQKLQDGPSIPGCTRERVVVALMFWSDETHLTSFGSAKLWPCYMFFGNESKYRRGKTSLNLCEHIAYFERLSDDFKDYLRGRNDGTLPPDKFIAHCAREMFHAQWKIMLDDDLLEAMEKGIVIMCPDGIERRFFPRIFTYSADYPEK
ncbi:hypothetical protein BKA70DRAFT_1441710 [Coprinopsis sp. MPI-PUGE-AT-0042]|nr:hypothetical protein BKA70DRAFT_1441710 [Coprinopsis sp. MPI-PUGE-AT-0042]